MMIEMDSLPPLCMDYNGALEERNIARQVLEYAVLLSVSMGDKEAFSRHISALKPFYGNIRECEETETMSCILGLNLLYLLVENRLADFHCELELLSDRQRLHPAVTFCTQLDKHLVVGSYDQVLVAAAHPPVKYYAFFLASLLETVRINIGECASAAYDQLSLAAATQILMFDRQEETLQFIADYYPAWAVVGDSVRLAGGGEAEGAAPSEQIASTRLITQSLSYATELERIV